MKKIGLLAVLLLSVSGAFAFNDDLQMDYISWCSAENQVMQYNQNGEVFVRFNCSESGQVCKSYQRPVGHHRIIVVAACENK